MIGFILSAIITGAIVGALARLALPGPDPMGIGETIAIGIGGAIGAGIAFRVLFCAPPQGFSLVLGAPRLVSPVRRPPPPARPPRQPPPAPRPPAAPGVEW